MPAATLKSPASPVLISDWAPCRVLERFGSTLRLPHSHLEPLGPAHGLQGAADEHDRPAVLQGALRAPALMGEPSDEFQVT